MHTATYQQRVVEVYVTDPVDGYTSGADGGSMTPIQITLEIPQEIPSQNNTGKGRTWQARAAGIKKARSLWRLATTIEMRRAGAVRATGPRSMHIIAYRTQRCADIANLIGGAKAVIDGMVDAGLLLDDRDSMARITYEQRVASKSPTKKKHTTIIVTEIIESGNS